MAGKKKTTGSAKKPGKGGAFVAQIDGSFHAGRKRKRTPKKAAKASK